MRTATIVHRALGSSCRSQREHPGSLALILALALQRVGCFCMSGAERVQAYRRLARIALQAQACGHASRPAGRSHHVLLFAPQKVKLCVTALKLLRKGCRSWCCWMCFEVGITPSHRKAEPMLANCTDFNAHRFDAKQHSTHVQNPLLRWERWSLTRFERNLDLFVHMQ